MYLQCTNKTYFHPNVMFFKFICSHVATQGFYSLPHVTFRHAAQKRKTKNTFSHSVKGKLDVGLSPKPPCWEHPCHPIWWYPCLKERFLSEHKLVGKIYVSLTLNFNLSPLVIPGFSLVGRMTDSWLIGKLWISVPSSQILWGFDQLPLKGIKTRRGELMPVHVVLQPLMVFVWARGYSRTQRSRYYGNTAELGMLCLS